MYRFLILIAFVSIIVASQLSCSLIPDVKTVDGLYKEIEGECKISISVKDLSHGKYVLILKDSEGVESEVSGNLVENVIFTKIGENSAYFSINKNRILMIYNDNKCIFEKVD